MSGDKHAKRGAKRAASLVLAFLLLLACVSPAALAGEQVETVSDCAPTSDELILPEKESVPFVPERQEQGPVPIPGEQPVTAPFRLWKYESIAEEAYTPLDQAQISLTAGQTTAVAFQDAAGEFLPANSLEVELSAAARQSLSVWWAIDEENNIAALYFHALPVWEDTEYMVNVIVPGTQEVMVISVMIASVRLPFFTIPDCDMPVEGAYTVSGEETELYLAPGEHGFNLDACEVWFTAEDKCFSIPFTLNENGVLAVSLKEVRHSGILSVKAAFSNETWATAKIELLFQPEEPAEIEQEKENAAEESQSLPRYELQLVEPGENGLLVPFHPQEIDLLSRENAQYLALFAAGEQITDFVLLETTGGAPEAVKLENGLLRVEGEQLQGDMLTLQLLPAGEDGPFLFTLAVEQPMQTETLDTAADPVFEVREGKTYCYIAGELQRGRFAWGDNTYYADGAGAMQTGWQNIQGTWRYFEPETFSELAATKQGNWYRVGQTFWYFKNGTILLKGWQTLDGQKYYFASDGSALTGWQKISGKDYCFTEKGTLLTGFSNVEGIPYFFDASGRVKTGWLAVNGEWYWFDSASEPYPGAGYHVPLSTGFWGELQKDGQIQRFYFKNAGAPVKGWQTLDGIRYYFDPVTGAQRTGWLDIGKNRYYVDPVLGMTKGLAEIEGQSYFFTTAGVLKTGWQKVSGDWYFFDPDKAGAGTLADPSSCWVEIEGQKYYFKNGVTPLKGWQTVEGVRYYFDPLTGAQRTGWLDIGKNRYHVDPVLGMTKGLAEIEGQSYFFTTAGVLKTGWQKVSGDWYFFDPDSVPQSGAGTKVDAENLWVKLEQPDGTFLEYYFKKGSTLAKGWQTIESVRYYFDSSTGALCTGWQTIGTKKYYISRQSGALTGWQTLEGKEYYFSTSGQMTTGWLTLTENKVRNKYWFGTDGTKRTGWINVNGKTYYLLPESGVLCTGFQNIQDILYCFDKNGALCTGWNKVQDAWYFFDVVQGGAGTLAVPDEQGWVTIGSTEYWFKNGKTPAKGWQTVAGIRFYFDPVTGAKRTGWLTLNGKLYYVNSTEGMLKGIRQVGEHLYYFDSGGAQKTGWYKVEGNWYYFDPEDEKGAGSIARPDEKGWVVINQKEYWFKNGITLAKGWQTVAGKRYYFDPSTGAKQTGWVVVSKKTYYINSDTGMHTGWLSIGGKHYYFAANGQMITGWLTLTESGTKTKYWFNAQGERAVGSVRIGNAFYRFDGDGRLSGADFEEINTPTGPQMVYYDANGKLLKGWLTLKANGATRKYWFDTNGYMVTGVQKIGANQYLFNGRGVLVTAPDSKYAVVEFDMAAKGEEENLQKALVNSSGIVKLGWQVLSGDTFYFDSRQAWMYSGGEYEIGGDWYFFAANGVRQYGWKQTGEFYKLFSYVSGKRIYAGGPDGWLTVTDGGKTKQYYYKNGAPLYDPQPTSEDEWARQIHTIDGKQYYFYPSHVASDQTLSYSLATDFWFSCYYGTKKKYFGSNGEAVTGRQEIEGEVCWFTEDGWFVFPPAFSSVTVVQNADKVTVTVNAQFPNGGHPEGSYSFDGGASWQTASSKEFSASGLLEAGRVQIRDAYYTIAYKQRLDLSAPQKGVDVSSYQGNIDWKEVKNSGVTFAMIRVGKYNGIDVKAEANIKGALNAGLHVGVYVYTYAWDAYNLKMELDDTFSLLRKLESQGYRIDYPVAIDYEDHTVLDHFGYSPAAADRATSMLVSGLDYIQGKGYTPMLYCSIGLYNDRNRLDKSRLRGYDFWVAHWTDRDKNYYRNTAKIWQYSSDGSVPGIVGRVDLNYGYYSSPPHT